MSRTALVGVLTGLMLTGAAVAATKGGAEQRHSGLIVAIAPDGHALTLEEMGRWQRPGNGATRGGELSRAY